MFHVKHPRLFFCRLFHVKHFLFLFSAFPLFSLQRPSTLAIINEHKHFYLIGYFQKVGAHVAKTIAIVNQKGGVGKTTTCVNLAAALTEAGQRILLCDFDPQANSTSGMGVDKTVSKGIYDALIGEVPVEDALVHTKYSDVLPSNKALAGAGIELIGMERREFLLRDALDKLKLNDASLSYEPESSVALGFGFRCGFLGMLHMEIIQERLEREFDLELVTTLPSVIYKVIKTDGSEVMVDNPHNYPDTVSIMEAYEPYVKVSIITPNEYVGNIMPLCQDRRGEYRNMQYLDANLVEMHYEMPLNEIIYDFFDTLKARTKGYASLDYEFSQYKTSDLVKVDMLLNGDQVDALSFIAHREKAYGRARKLCEKLKDNIPRQLFEVPVQAAIGGKIIARETVKAMRKDVLAKCYGGDITRKKKLLEKQKEGKKRMRTFGTVSVPSEAFMAVLKLDED